MHVILAKKSAFAKRTVIKFFNKKCHTEIQRGTKKDAEDYIKKRGRFEEKDELVIAVREKNNPYRDSDYKGSRQGERTDIEGIKEDVKSGMGWRQIMRKYKMYEPNQVSTIKNIFFDERRQQIEAKRDVKVHWVTGDSGSGKTGIYLDKVKEYGEDEVYLVNEYQNPFDNYEAQKILILDEFRNQIKYANLLSILEGYKREYHARYANVVGLWTEIYITTIKTIEQSYEKMINSFEDDDDPISQLYSRITDITYCYKVNRAEASKTDRRGKSAEFFKFVMSTEDYLKLDKNRRKYLLRKTAYDDYKEKYYQADDIVEAFADFM